MQRRNEQGGFTLLELIIVLVLMGIFIVISVPALRDTMIDDPLSASGRRLIGYIDGVREMAVREQQGYLLRIDLDENVISFIAEKEITEEEGTVSSDKNTLFRPKGDVRLRSIWMQSQELTVGGIVELWVSRQGYLEKSVLHLEDGGRDVLSFELYPFLVQIDIHDGLYEPERNES